MHKIATAALMAHARHGSECGCLLSKIVHESTEVGVVVPSILAAKLKAAGYVIESEPRGNSVQVEVKAPLAMLAEQKHRTALDYIECETRDPKAAPPDPATLLVVARGQSFNEADALLQAVAAELRELHGKAEREGIASA